MVLYILVCKFLEWRWEDKKLNSMVVNIPWI
jgi:hypothetical protein